MLYLLLITKFGEQDVLERMPSVLQNDKSVSRLKGTSEWVIPAAREPNYVRFALGRSESGASTKIAIFSVQKVRIL